MVGFDETGDFIYLGKTTILFKLNMKNITTTTPRIGITFVLFLKGLIIETAEYKNLLITNFDIHFKFQTLDTHKNYNTYNFQYFLKYFKQIQKIKGVVFVVDSNDRKRFIYNKDILQQLFDELLIEKLKNIPILILANKQDLSNAMNTTEITNQMVLRSLKRKWNVQECSAITGNGLKEGLKWLKNNI